MGQNTLPPGVEVFLSSEMGVQLQSAMRSLYENIMLDTASGEQLTDLGIDLGVPRPPALFSVDDLWRASVRVVAYGRKHTRSAVVNLIELILGPRVSQVTTLSRTVYEQIAKGNTLTIDPPSPNAGNYSVSEILTHHLIFPAGTFTVPDLNVSYTIEGTNSFYGNIIALPDGRQALVDTTVMFVNTHLHDFITALNSKIPQYGTVIFDKNAVTPHVEQSFTYGYYDNNLSGILKLDSLGSSSSVTRNKSVRMRSSLLNLSVNSGALSIQIQDSTNFPTSPALVETIQVGDSVTILTVPPVTPAPAANITAVSTHEITIGGGGLPVPGAPLTAEFKYIITSPGSTELNGGRGHFLSKKGKILSATRLVDYTVDFLKLLKPYVAGVREPFNVVINRGHSNEETVEVLSRVGTTLNLVLDPNNALNQTSILKFDHSKGETVEVVTKESYSTGAYYPLTVAGVTVGTVSAGSTMTNIRDLVNTPFVTANGSATYGDELEIVTTVATGPAVGETRTIIAAPAANNVNVSPAFTGLTTVGCTYRVRKLYKPWLSPFPAISNEDRFLYLADTSMFPAANFSVILDRGNTQEEVVWIDQNTLATNTLRIANSDLGTAAVPVTYLSKSHNFGVVVEPAQVLVEACNWDIMETRATGEFTLAIEDACVPAVDVKDAWFLHEKTPAHLVNASSGVGVGVAPVRGDDFVGGFPTDFTYIPRAPLAAAIVAGTRTFQLTNSNFIRLLASKPDENNIKSGNLIFRPIYIDDGNAKEEKFAVLVLPTSFGSLVQNTIPGATTFISSIDIPVGVRVFIGQWNSKYPTLERVETVLSTGSSLIPAGNLYAGSYTITALALTYQHFAGESLVTDPVTISTSEPFENAYAAPASAFVNYTYTHPSYRCSSDIIKAANMVSSTTVDYPARQTYARNTFANEFSRYIVNDELYIKGPVLPIPAASLGERRSIAAVGGIGNQVLFVDDPVQFSATIDTGNEFDIRPFLQSGDISTDTRKDISNNTNTALQPYGLNAVNLELYAGGHKSIFPGSYLYRLLNEDSTQADQPKSNTYKLLSAPDAIVPAAIYKFPGPRRLISPPAVPYAEETSGAGANTLTSTDITVGGLVGKYVEILGPSDSRDYRSIRKIIAQGPIDTISVDFSYVDKNFPITPYKFRVLGTGEALSPGSTELWIDYPEIFPDPTQGEFIVTVGRGISSAEEIQITACANNVLGADYGKCVINTVEKIDGTFAPGTSVELKITTIVDPTGAAEPDSGGIYLAFGYEPDLYRVQEIGVGADPTISGGNGNPVDLIAAAVHPPVEYNSPIDETNTLKKGMYTVPANGIKLPTATLANTQVRCTVLTAAGVLPAPSSTIQISDFNFLKQKYKWFIGGSVSTFGSIATQTITDIEPANSTITVTPAYAAADLPAAGSPIVLLAKKVPVDNKERQSEIDNFFTLGKFGTTSGTEHVGIFPTVITTIGSTLTTVMLGNSVPLSTALIGSQVLVTASFFAVLVGQQRTIVDITESVPWVSGYDQLVVSPAFTGFAPANSDTLVIIPPHNLKFSNLADTAGGVYTGINHPNPINNGGTTYPALTTSNLSTGVNREYGIVQEYVEYSSRSGNILTLSEPFYPKYDHLPGSTVVSGTNQFTTQGYGKDYRPFLTSSYLELLFNSDVIDLKSLFCAAGIDGKTEVTELGS